MDLTDAGRHQKHGGPPAGAQTGLGQAENGRNAFLDRLADGWNASGFSGAAAALAIPLNILLARVPPKE
jgi:hypothetical protein